MNARNDNPIPHDPAAAAALPPDPDPQLSRCLDEALAPDQVAGGIPADLAERIVHLTRDQLALDRALGADQAASAAPGDLAGRIFNATRDKLPGAGSAGSRDRQSDRAGRGGILARLGPERVRKLRHLAASIILLMEAGIWATLIGIADDARALTQVRQELKTLARYERPDSPIDHELRLLQAQVDTQLGSTWADSTFALDQAMDEWEAMMSTTEPSSLF